LKPVAALAIFRGEDDLHEFIDSRPGRPGVTRRFIVAWVILFVAGILEVVWAFYMKKSDGFTLVVPAAITLVAMIASFALLSIAMRTLPLGTAYAVWTGIGAVGAFLLGIVVLGEAATPMRLAAAALIVAGIGLMKLASDQ
jgi:quaternary ammonium compound-resistance protein SugE